MSLRLIEAEESVEIFHIPQDYPSVEDENGRLLASGFWWWLITADCTPDSYPSGPFQTRSEALDDWQMAGAWEMIDEE